MNRAELIQQIKNKKSFLCIGLDFDLSKTPDCIKDYQDPVLEFNKQIIDATIPYAVAYKPNIAFYEVLGDYGFSALKNTIAYIRKTYPDTLVILDAKRGDIGNTSRMYAKVAFDYYQSDAITLSPYMGQDSVQPFLDYQDKWVILLALTSNQGSEDFQLLKVGDTGEHLFERIIKTSSQWGTSSNTMYVVGATRSSFFKSVREVAPDHFLLVPGIGAQGGALEDVCEYGLTSEGGLLVNASRSIIYSSNTPDFASHAAEQARTYQKQMEYLLAEKGVV